MRVSKAIVWRLFAIADQSWMFQSESELLTKDQISIVYHKPQGQIYFYFKTA